jgi:hypothetical protein
MFQFWRRSAPSALPERRVALKAAGRIDPLGEDRTLVEMLVSAKGLKDGRTLSIQPDGVRSSLSCYELADEQLLLDPETLPVLSVCSVPDRDEQPMPALVADSAESPDTGEISPESLEDMRCRERLGDIGHKLQELDIDQALIVDEDAYFTVEALSAVGLEPRDSLPLLAKEGLLAMPAGATRKITSIAGIDCVGITDRGIRIIWPLE